MGRYRWLATLVPIALLEWGCRSTVIPPGNVPCLADLGAAVCLLGGAIHGLRCRASPMALMLYGCMAGVIAWPAFEPDSRDIIGMSMQGDSVWWYIAPYCMFVIGCGLFCRSSNRLFFRRAPRKLPIGICRVCQYCLYGLQSNRCPECGTPFFADSADKKD